MTDDGFRASARVIGDVAVLDLQGQIDAGADAAIQSAYEQAEAGEPGSIALNFSDVSYINSTGIALVVGILARARRAQKPVLAFGLTDHYRQIFEITRLADFVEIHTDEASALARVP